MPIHKVKMPNGKDYWQYGSHGAVYPTRKQAEEQAAAIHASGFKESTKKGKK